MGNNQDNSSPFNDIISILEQYENLKHEIMYKFDADEIHIQWRTYIDYCIPKLTELNSLSITLFQRYFDEYEKEKTEQNDNLKDLINKLTNILRLIFESTVIIDLYLQFCKSNDRDNYNKNMLKFYIQNEKDKQFIGELFFRSNVPKEALMGISDMMIDQYKVNQFERILSNVENEVDNSELLLAAYKAKADYFLNNVGSNFKNISSSWWWNDNIIQSYVYTMARKQLIILKDLVINPNSKIYDVVKNKLPVTSALEIYYYSIFLYKKGIYAARQGMHKQAYRYFTMVSDNCKKGMDILDGNDTNTAKSIIDDFDKLQNKITLVKHISQLTTKYNVISKNILINNRSGILKVLGEIKEISNEHHQQMEIRYLSALPGLFTALASTIELLFTLGKEIDELSEELNQRLLQFNSRLDVACSQIKKDLEELDQRENMNDTKIKINSIIQDLDILMETASFIPNSIIERISTIKHLSTLKSLAISIQEDIKAYEVKNENYMLMLIYKAKANFHAKQALSKLREQNFAGLPVDRIQAQYTGSFISGKQKEIEIYQLTIQFICINKILPNFLVYLTQQDKLLPIELVKDELWNDNSFAYNLKQILNDCESLISHKENSSNPMLSGVYWENIMEKKKLVLALLQFYDSIKFAIVGSLLSQQKNFEDARLNFIQAQDNAFSGANQLQGIMSKTLSEYSSHIYSFGQFCQESSNKAQSKIQVRIPVQEVVKLFRDMVFNI